MNAPQQPGNQPAQAGSALALTQQQNHQMVAMESAGTMAAATAKATVEARYLMALRNPRVWDQVRTDMLKECSRPSFARNKSVWYRKPVGSGVEGFGVRFTEMAARCMKNIMVESVMLYEDQFKEVHRIVITDLESNLTFPEDYKVSKTVERSKPRSDGSYLDVRTNSKGELTYTVPAEEDDLLNKRGALKSKAKRNALMQLIPGDILDECEARIKGIRRSDAAEDPDAVRRGIVDDFATIGVSATMLTELVGHDLVQCSPTELVELRGLFDAIDAGEATWATAVANKAEQPKEPKPTPKPTSAPPPASAADVYSQAEFEAKLPGWREVIETGRKTPPELVTMAESKGRKMTEMQKATLLSIKRVPGATPKPTQAPTAAPTPAPTAAPSPTAPPNLPPVEGQGEAPWEDPTPAPAAGGAQ